MKPPIRITLRDGYSFTVGSGLDLEWCELESILTAPDAKTAVAHIKGALLVKHKLGGQVDDDV